MDKVAYHESVVDIIHRFDAQKGFEVLQRRCRRAYLRLDDPLAPPRSRL